MTKEELAKIREYIEIHSRKESHTIKITQIMKKALVELERIAELEAQIEQLQKINNKQRETLKKVRVALIQERTANIINYGIGGVEMFESMFEILKSVSN